MDFNDEEHENITTDAETNSSQKATDVEFLQTGHDISNITKKPNEPTRVASIKRQNINLADNNTNKKRRTDGCFGEIDNIKTEENFEILHLLKTCLQTTTNTADSPNSSVTEDFFGNAEHDISEPVLHPIIEHDRDAIIPANVQSENTVNEEVLSTNDSDSNDTWEIVKVDTTYSRLKETINYNTINCLQNNDHKPIKEETSTQETAQPRSATDWLKQMSLKDSSLHKNSESLSDVQVVWESNNTTELLEDMSSNTSGQASDCNGLSEVASNETWEIIKIDNTHNWLKETSLNYSKYNGKTFAEETNTQKIDESSNSTDCLKQISLKDSSQHKDSKNLAEETSIQDIGEPSSSTDSLKQMLLEDSSQHKDCKSSPAGQVVTDSNSITNLQENMSLNDSDICTDCNNLLEQTENMVINKSENVREWFEQMLLITSAQPRRLSLFEEICVPTEPNDVPGSFEQTPVMNSPQHKGRKSFSNFLMNNGTSKINECQGHTPWMDAKPCSSQNSLFEEIPYKSYPYSGILKYLHESSESEKGFVDTQNGNNLISKPSSTVVSDCLNKDGKGLQNDDSNIPNGMNACFQSTNQTQNENFLNSTCTEVIPEIDIPSTSTISEKPASVTSLVLNAESTSIENQIGNDNPQALGSFYMLENVQEMSKFNSKCNLLTSVERMQITTERSKEILASENTSPEFSLETERNSLTINVPELDSCNIELTNNQLSELDAIKEINIENKNSDLERKGRKLNKRKNSQISSNDSASAASVTDIIYKMEEETDLKQMNETMRFNEMQKLCLSSPMITRSEPSEQAEFNKQPDILQQISDNILPNFAEKYPKVCKTKISTTDFEQQSSEAKVLKKSSEDFCSQTTRLILETKNIQVINEYAYTKQLTDNLMSNRITNPDADEVFNPEFDKKGRNFVDSECGQLTVANTYFDSKAPSNDLVRDSVNFLDESLAKCVQSLCEFFKRTNDRKTSTPNTRMCVEDKSTNVSLINPDEIVLTSSNHKFDTELLSSTKRTKIEENECGKMEDFLALKEIEDVHENNENPQTIQLKIKEISSMNETLSKVLSLSETLTDKRLLQEQDAPCKKFCKNFFKSSISSPECNATNKMSFKQTEEVYEGNENSQMIQLMNEEISSTNETFGKIPSLSETLLGKRSLQKQDAPSKDFSKSFISFPESNAANKMSLKETVDVYEGNENSKIIQLNNKEISATNEALGRIVSLSETPLGKRSLQEQGAPRKKICKDFSKSSILSAESKATNIMSLKQTEDVYEGNENSQIIQLKNKEISSTNETVGKIVSLSEMLLGKRSLQKQEAPSKDASKSSILFPERNSTNKMSLKETEDVYEVYENSQIIQLKSKEISAANETLGNIASLSETPLGKRPLQEQGAPRKKICKDLSKSSILLPDSNIPNKMLQVHLENLGEQGFTVQDVVHFIMDSDSSVSYFNAVHSARIFLREALNIKSLKMHNGKYVMMSTTVRSLRPWEENTKPDGAFNDRFKKKINQLIARYTEVTNIKDTESEENSASELTKEDSTARNLCKFSTTLSSDNGKSILEDHVDPCQTFIGGVQNNSTQQKNTTEN